MCLHVSEENKENWLRVTQLLNAGLPCLANSPSLSSTSEATIFTGLVLVKSHQGRDEPLQEEGAELHRQQRQDCGHVVTYLADRYALSPHGSPHLFEG